jgi:dTDP-N-acetylfucosamine:lipid II N-acetylfucosaminyltransferase
MYLHLVTDEKFIDAAITLFNRNDPGHHTFLLLYKGTFSGFQYVKLTDAVQTVLVGSEKYEECLSKLSSYDAVFVHGLFSPHALDLINKASADAIFVWLFWGGELWSFKNIRYSLMLPSTRRLYLRNRLGSWMSANVRKYVSLIKQREFGVILRNISQSNKSRLPVVIAEDTVALERAIGRVNFIIPVVRDDFYVLKKHFSLKAQVLDWSYPMGITLDSLENKRVSGDNILVGNSAHYSNNHIDMFKLLRKKRISFNKCIVPLSYGDEEYRKSILKAGSQLLGSQFQPLTEFMPIGEYLQIISSCSCAFFNVRRQQAMGNIALMLLLGARVYLREENPAFSFLMRKGIDLFSIARDMQFCKTDVSGYLSFETVQKRWKILFSLCSESAMTEKTCNMLNFLKKKRP